MSLGYDDAGECVLLATVYDVMEAQIIVARLRSAGIQTYLKHEALGVVYGLTVDGAGQQDIMVRADELGEARAALETEG
jgi:Putative prokaryotic signal transducing protein